MASGGGAVATQLKKASDMQQELIAHIAQLRKPIMSRSRTRQQISEETLALELLQSKLAALEGQLKLVANTNVDKLPGADLLNLRTDMERINSEALQAAQAAELVAFISKAVIKEAMTFCSPLGKSSNADANAAPKARRASFSEAMPRRDVNARDSDQAVKANPSGLPGFKLRPTGNLPTAPSASAADTAAEQDLPPPVRQRRMSAVTSDSSMCNIESVTKTAMGMAGMSDASVNSTATSLARRHTISTPPPAPPVEPPAQGLVSAAAGVLARPTATSLRTHPQAGSGGVSSGAALSGIPSLAYKHTGPANMPPPAPVMSSSLERDEGQSMSRAGSAGGDGAGGLSSSGEETFRSMSLMRLSAMASTPPNASTESKASQSNRPVSRLPSAPGTAPTLPPPAPAAPVVHPAPPVPAPSAATGIKFARPLHVTLPDGSSSSAAPPTTTNTSTGGASNTGHAAATSNVGALANQRGISLNSPMLMASPLLTDVPDLPPFRGSSGGGASRIPMAPSSTVAAIATAPATAVPAASAPAAPVQGPRPVEITAPPAPPAPVAPAFKRAGTVNLSTPAPAPITITAAPTLAPQPAPADPRTTVAATTAAATASATDKVKPDSPPTGSAAGAMWRQREQATTTKPAATNIRPPGVNPLNLPKPTWQAQNQAAVAEQVDAPAPAVPTTVKTLPAVTSAGTPALNVVDKLEKPTAVATPAVVREKTTLEPTRPAAVAPAPPAPPRPIGIPSVSMTAPPSEPEVPPLLPRPQLEHMSQPHAPLHTFRDSNPMLEDFLPGGQSSLGISDDYQGEVDVDRASDDVEDEVEEQEVASKVLVVPPLALGGSGRLSSSVGRPVLVDESSEEEQQHVEEEEQYQEDDEEVEEEEEEDGAAGTWSGGEQSQGYVPGGGTTLGGPIEAGDFAEEQEDHDEERVDEEQEEDSPGSVTLGVAESTSTLEITLSPPFNTLDNIGPNTTSTASTAAVAGGVAAAAATMPVEDTCKSTAATLIPKSRGARGTVEINTSTTAVVDRGVTAGVTGAARNHAVVVRVPGRRVSGGEVVAMSTEPGPGVGLGFGVGAGAGVGVRQARMSGGVVAGSRRSSSSIHRAQGLPASALAAGSALLQAGLVSVPARFQMPAHLVHSGAGMMVLHDQSLDEPLSIVSIAQEDTSDEDTRSEVVVGRRRTSRGTRRRENAAFVRGKQRRGLWGAITGLVGMVATASTVAVAAGLAVCAAAAVNTGLEASTQTQARPSDAATTDDPLMLRKRKVRQVKAPRSALSAGRG